MQEDIDRETRKSEQCDTIRAVTHAKQKTCNDVT